ncbi:MAG: murein hydrolase activator EnvC family protein [Coriobacteriia bacterium]
MSPARACCSVVLAAVLSMSMAAKPGYAASAGEARAHERRASEARRNARDADREAQRLADEIADLDHRIDAASAKVDELDPLLAAATERTTRIQREVDVLAKNASDARVRLEANAAEHERQRDLLSERVVATYRQGDWFYLEVLIGSRGVSDLILRTELISRVLEANTRVASDLKRTGGELARDQILLDRTLSSAELKRNEVSLAEARLKELQSQHLATVRQVTSAKADRASMMADSKQNAKRLRALAESEEAESRRIEDELAGSNGGSGQYNGKMTWPVPSSHRITSSYGWRTCPFHGRELHPALDIGAPEGSAIIAAGSGKVIYVGYRGSYGNTVMIDHGDGVVTLYPHQAAGAIRVSVGQRVERGERIGGVGSTGNATGPHLHFEVRVNGSPRNPASWL